MGVVTGKLATQGSPGLVGVEIEFRKNWTLTARQAADGEH
jgi:hypothetical protein